jgi:hypothetical protein
VTKKLIPKHYLVGVFDVVGLSNTFQTFNGLPAEADAESPLHGALQETVGFLEWGRSTFADLFHEYPVEKNKIAPYDRDLNHIEKLLAEPEVKLQAFADLLVPYALLPKESHHLRALSTVLRMFHAAGRMLVTAMAGGRAIRGGIDAESAIERAPNEIYGRALNDALALEVRQADYPRIVVGKNLIDYLKQITTLSEHSVFVDHAKTLAARCSRLITADADGQSMLHYLGPDFPAQSFDAGTLAQAKSFITQQIAYWTTQNQPRLTEKYRRLNLYWQRAKGTVRNN